MDYKGFYINLDRSHERRAEMEAHLAERGLTGHYRRFAAAEGNTLNFPNPKLLPGEIGCFTSQYLLMKENLDSAAPLHIIEDDVLFSSFTLPVIQSLIGNNSFDTYDIIHLDTFVLTSPVLYKRYHQLYCDIVRRAADGKVEEANFQLIDMQNIDFASCASMMIAPRAIHKLHDLYAAQLASGPQTAVDLFIRNKVREGVLRVGCIFPFATSLRLEHVLGTTINERNLRLTALATVIARHAFFVEADWNKCLEYASRYLNAPANDPQREVLTHILGFALDERFRFA